MQWRTYNRKTLEYRDGGYVVDYIIDDDYIVNNNSTITIIKAESEKEDFLNNTVVGDIIVLIKDSGAFHKGVITAIDASALTISYRSSKELFNDNIPNPLADSNVFTDNESDNNIAGKFGVEQLIHILESWFAKNNDTYINLPLVFETNGDVVDADGNPRMLWTWSNDSINVVDWLTELFEKYNLTMDFDIDFDTAQSILPDRKPKYIITFSALVNSGNVIKDNVAMQTITYTTKELPEATVCYVIDSETKRVMLISEGVNLFNPAAGDTETRLDNGNNVIKNDTSQFYNVSGYIGITPTIKTSDDKEIWQSYTWSIQNPYDNYLRWVWCYDKEKKRIAAFCYKFILNPNGTVDIVVAPREELLNPSNTTYRDTVYESGSSLPNKTNGTLTFTALDLVTKYRFVANGKYVDKSGNILDKDGNPTTAAVYDLAKKIRYLRFCYPNEHYARQLGNDTQMIQLEKGNTFTTFDYFDKPTVYYLYNKNGVYGISRDANSKNDGIRVMPVKTAIISYNSSSEDSGSATPTEAAREKLIPSQFNQAIEIRINANSKMFDFANAQFGDLYKIVNKQGTIDSVFTGKKLKSNNAWVTLYFGLGRQNYTDIREIRLRKQRYTELYNMGG